MEKKSSKKTSISSHLSRYSIPIGFLILILVGAALLMLPWSTSKGQHTSFLTALFTSTTSVCVTGSTVVDTATHWSNFGKAVILTLVQLGGLGIIASVVFFTVIARRTYSLGKMLALKEMFTLDSTINITKIFKQIILMTLTAEGIGAALYMPAFCSQYGAVKGIGYSIFTAVSAFCNAGLTIVESNNLENYYASPLVMIVTMMLIILGGIGFLVLGALLDIPGQVKGKSNKRKLAMRIIPPNSKLVLLLTFILIVGGAVIFFILEYSNPGTIGKMPTGQKILNSLFQSVTTRTAGFSTVPQGNLTETSCLVSDLLMFIGGSPLGTAGGVKTVTICIVLMNVFAFLANRDEVVLFKRHIPEGLIRKATAIVTIQLMIILIITVLLMVASNAPLTDALFETASAVSTVGLSRGLTPELNTVGQWLIMIGMFLGRVGPISMLLFFRHRSDINVVHYAEGKYIVG